MAAPARSSAPQSFEPQAPNPRWWTPSHASAWERVKEALRRDWEQTRVDLGGRGSELNQDIGDTVRQALGREALPAPDQPNPDAARGGNGNERWEEVEPAMRYGYGARKQHPDRPEWNEELELQLRREWEEMAPARLWHDVRQFVHRGWMGP